jgi:GNAT superfamily N-acetyltransferase
MTSSSPITVREVSAADIEVWIDLCAGLFAEDGGVRDAYANTRWPEVNGASWFRMSLADPRALLLFAECDGVAVGALCGRFRDSSEYCTAPTANLGSLFVQREFRSRAVGSQLVDRFKKWASELGARRLTVTAYASNEDAIRFYRRHGFAAFEVTLALDVPDVADL